MKTWRDRWYPTVEIPGSGEYVIDEKRAEVAIRGLLRVAGIAHKHEVQTWLDEPGTAEEKLARVLSVVRETLASCRFENAAMDDERKS